MRKCRVIGIAIASLLTLGSIAQAQTAAPGTPQARQQRGGRFERGRGRLLRGIKLSDAEKARLKEIRGKYRTDAQTLRSEGDRQKLQALMQRERTELRTALTPEHQTQYDANVKQLDQRRAGRKNGGRGHRGRKADGVGTSKS